MTNLLRGLSPLARGNHSPLLRVAHIQGPIPARAGEPAYTEADWTACGAYPRSRGGTGLAAFHAASPDGLSPLARGNRALTASASPIPGPIPARAGEPLHRRHGRHAVWAYPRSRGGTAALALCAERGRGLSPLARGNLCDRLHCLAETGPIPARAGEPLTPKVLRRKRKHRKPCEILKSVCSLAAPGQPHAVHFNQLTRWRSQMG